MKLRLYKMGIEGAVAVVNLSLIGVALVAFRVAFPKGFIDHNAASATRLLVADLVWFAVHVLSFPVGWLGYLLDGSDHWLLTAPIYIPLNAYVWGYTVAAIRRKRRRRQVNQPAQGPSPADST